MQSLPSLMLIYYISQKLNLQADLLIMKRLMLHAGSTHFEHLMLILKTMDEVSITPDREFIDLVIHKFETGKSKLVEQVNTTGI